MEVLDPPLPTVLKEEVEKFRFKVLQIFMHGVLIKTNEFSALCDPLRLDYKYEGVNIALFVFQRLVQVQKLSVDSASLLKR